MERLSIVDNTWEPVENLDCLDLIAAFEDKLKNKAIKNITAGEAEDSQKKPKSATASEPEKAVTTQKEASDEKKLTGFDRGLQPERILGATDASEQLIFFMKWVDSDEAELVPAKQANSICPQIVIQFYEERLNWQHTAKNSGNKN